MVVWRCPFCKKVNYPPKYLRLWILPLQIFIVSQAILSYMLGMLLLTTSVDLCNILPEPCTHESKLRFCFIHCSLFASTTHPLHECAQKTLFRKAIGKSVDSRAGRWWTMGRQRRVVTDGGAAVGNFSESEHRGSGLGEENARRRQLSLQPPSSVFARPWWRRKMMDNASPSTSSSEPRNTSLGFNSVHGIYYLANNILGHQ